VRLHADLIPVAGVKPGAARPTPSAVTPPPATPGELTQPPVAGRPPAGGRDKPDRPREERAPRGGRPTGDGDDIFESVKTPAGGRKPAAKTGDDEDIFETQGKSATGGGGDCIATISSKPWAEVSIDGKPTGKITPLVNYPIPCGKHRLTFKNADLMIERNESVTLKPGQPFKKIFSLVENEL
jgi:eukaryotic-like serine/threonine-protein kinase